MQIWESRPVVKLVALSERRQSAVHPQSHDHPFYELGLVLSGQCDWHLTSRRRMLLRVGDAILLKPRTMHREVVPESSAARLAWVGFDFSGTPPPWVNRVIATASDFAEIAGYLEILVRERHRPDDGSSLVRLGLAAQSLLLLVSRRAEQPGSRLSRAGSDLNPRQVRCVESAAHYFRANFSDALSIAQVAAYHSLCPAHFSILFRRHQGKSPRSFLRQVRLDRVAELLTTSDLALKEIAAACGFVDAAHLCKTFKEAKGVTPRLFRLGAR